MGPESSKGKLMFKEIFELSEAKETYWIMDSDKKTTSYGPFESNWSEDKIKAYFFAACWNGPMFQKRDVELVKTTERVSDPRSHVLKKYTKITDDNFRMDKKMTDFIKSQGMEADV